MQPILGGRAAVATGALVLLLGCGSSGDDNSGEMPNMNLVTGPMAGATGAAGSNALPPTSGMTAGSSAGMNTAGSGEPMMAAAGSVATTMAGSEAPIMNAGSMAEPPMAGSGSTPPTPAGPEDGDPNAPIIAIDEVACGGPTGGFGLGSPNHQMDGRDMIVTYPCDKHGGAPATFFLNLHGTTPVAQHFYQHGYFSVHQFAASHNLIVVTPSSVVQQWGNGDNGEDEPHLMKIIEWVYATLGGPDKFDIRAMWVGGHSWGGGYTARFGCKAELADKVKGLVLMSGGGVSGFGGAACASSVSVLISTAEGDGRMPSDQATVAAGHGCGTAQTEMILADNVHTFWPDCEPGFVHANYYMLMKEHATFMDKEVVESMADWIKLSRQ